MITGGSPTQCRDPNEGWGCGKCEGKGSNDKICEKNISTIQ